MSFSLKRALIILPIVFNAFTSIAQFKIIGVVSDANTNEPLPGTTVITEDSKHGSVTDLNGKFELKNIKQNSVKVTFSFISYQPTTLTFDFSNNHTQNCNVKLSPVSTELEQVQVVGEAKGNVKALHEQRVAENIKNVVSYEQLEQFPDMNAAEAIQRIPGITLQRDQGDGRFVQLRGTPPEYTNFNVNGEQIPSPEGGVRYVGLDVISAEQIEFIEVIKVLTPDMDADGIAGSVNIITKTASSEKPQITASIAGGYNNLREKENYQTQFSFAQRTGKFGFSIDGNYYLNNQGSHNMEFEYRKDAFFNTVSQQEGINNYHVQYNEFQLRHYEITRERTGLSTTLDYKFSNTAQIYLRGMYNKLVDQETRRRVIYTLDDAVTETYYLYGGVERDLKDREKTQNLSTLNLGGNFNLLGNIKFDFETSMSIASENQPDRIEMTFDNPGQAIAMEFDLTNNNTPLVTFPNSNQIENAYDYDNYDMDEFISLKSSNEEKNLTSKLNIEIPYKFTFGHGFFKFGGKYRQKTKWRDINALVYTKLYSDDNPYYPGEAPTNPLTVMEDGFSENNLLNEEYVVDHTPGPDEVRAFYEYYPQFFYINNDDTKDKTLNEDYNAEENNYATYGMLKYNYEKLTFVGGVRYDQTDITYKKKNINKDKRAHFVDAIDVIDERTIRFLLPQFSLKYSPLTNLNIRVAATRSFTRPNFKDLIPTIDKERDKIALGNANLKFPTATNIDFLAEYYTSHGGIISGGIFYKYIENYIYRYRIFGYADSTSARTGGSRLRIEVPLNGKYSNVYGAEIQGQFKFYFLPAFLKNFGIYANYTFTHSKAYVAKRYPSNDHSHSFILGTDSFESLASQTEQEILPLPGQAKHALNLALYYETKKFYAKISTNYHDPFLYSLGADSDLDEYYDKSTHIDFNANYSITKYLKVFTDIINLTNAPLRFYLNTPDKIIKQEYYSWWTRLGVKLNF